MSLQAALNDYLNIDLHSMCPAGFLDREASQIQITVDNVDRGKGWIPNRTCPVCGSENRNAIMQRFGRCVVQCQDCEIAYMDSFPADPEDVYSHEGYNDTQETNYLHNVDYRRKRFALERLNIIRRHMSKSPATTRILDVGCGTGWFLEVALQEGFAVSGLELGREIAAATSKRLKIKVFTETIQQMAPTEKFDVITLFDVLEHVPDPQSVLRAVKDHLHPGGIALLFCPNLDSVGLSILRERSSLVMPAEHLFYFTPKSLRRLIEQTPLEVAEFMTKGMDIPDIMSHFRDEKHSPEVAAFLSEQCRTLQAVIDSAGCANHMRFVVRQAQ